MTKQLGQPLISIQILCCVPYDAMRTLFGIYQAADDSRYAGSGHTHPPNEFSLSLSFHVWSYEMV